MKRNKGFTLVELLAVIVILAIILVIAVPKVMSVIEDAKKATLESTAKMIASQAEKAKVQNTVLGKTDAITCDSVAKINDLDYDSCSIDFVDNTAKVTIKGKGKFAGLYVCSGTKTDAVAQEDLCTEPIEVKYSLFLPGQAITPNKFIVKLNNDDGSSKILEDGTRMVVDESAEPTVISSPNWPENHLEMSESENYWEITYEGADAIQITFDEATKLDYGSYIFMYDNSGNKVYELGYNLDFGGNSYIINGNYAKVTMSSDYGGKGFSATVKPTNKLPAEYEVRPSVAPNTDGNFDITITINGENTTKKITTATVHNAEDYIQSLEPFNDDVVKKIVEYNGKTYNAGTRYIGKTKQSTDGSSIVKNKVYYNCDDIDSAGVSYGETNYDYASSCEVWRIIGVFDTKSSEEGKAVPRVKIINTESTFKAGWEMHHSNINAGDGINQWGESTYEDGTIYEGADLMQLLNGYYIGKTGSECKYNTGTDQSEFVQTCTAESLTTAKMKPLTSVALSMSKSAVWDTYAVERPSQFFNANWESIVYLEEKGISAQYTGKSLCETTGGDRCNDKLERTTSWAGLVGLMSLSDMTYANGWLFNEAVSPWTITPEAAGSDATYVWHSSHGPSSYYSFTKHGVWPSVYLKEGIKIIGGNGDDEPYKLSIS